MNLRPAEQEAEDCFRAFRDVKVGDLVNHLHHTAPLETLTEPIENRIRYILRNKKREEQALRFRSMRPARVSLSLTRNMQWRNGVELLAKECLEKQGWVDKVRKVEMDTTRMFRRHGVYTESIHLPRSLRMEMSVYHAKHGRDAEIGLADSLTRVKLVQDRLMFMYEPEYPSLFGVEWKGNIFLTFGGSNGTY